MKKIAFLLVIIFTLSSVCFADGSWLCPSCSKTGNTGNFCSECGTKKPNDNWLCPSCGKAGNTGNFCGECGTKKPDNSLSEDIASFEGLNIGDSVFFGSYDQDGNTSNGAERIEWLVLDKKNGSYMLITYDVLDAMQFHSTRTSVKWSQSSLRKWLNSYFYDSSFTAAEKAMIQTTSVYTPASPYYPDVWSGFTSEDKVFLLSIQEALQYFYSNYDRQAFPTEKAVQNGIQLSSDNTVWWWLRSPGNRSYAAAGVYTDGSIYAQGDDVNRTIDGIRPVIWVNPKGTVQEPVQNQIEVGQTYYFGSYEQNCSYSDGPEEIAWRVLDIQNGKALLMSEYVLDSFYYNNLADNITWKDCTLRVWLNNNFYNSAFNSAEKNRIVASSIIAEANPTNTYAVAGGNTNDRVFVLSASEVSRYLRSNYDLSTCGTDYAKYNGVYYNEDLGTTWWWVRTPGKSNKRAVRVLSTGELDYEGTFVNSDNGGVRPAIWITID